METKCTLPPEGWHCSRRPGHPGPCAARPTEDTMVGWTLDLQRQVRGLQRTVVVLALATFVLTVNQLVHLLRVHL